MASVVDAAAGQPGASGECFRIPQGVPARQLGGSVTNWLDRNPTARSGNSAAAAIKVLQEAYPCSR